MTPNKVYRVAAYCRLSKDDGSDNESASIATQKAIIGAYINEHGWLLADTYVDDGYTGTNFDRPAFKRMIADIENGKIDCVITKDLSRLGRNYLDCGLYQEVFFPEHGVRYIAINDAVDTENRKGMDITPFRNILNEMYAADISMKVKSACHTRFLAGNFRGSNAPYGYKKDPNNRNRLVINEDAAEVVRKIYELALAGNGVRRIRNYLTAQGILRPSAYAAEHGATTFDWMQSDESKRCHWTENTVRMILRDPTYAGNLCGYKRPCAGMKSKKRLCRKPDEWEVVPDTHEGIVSQAVFDRVQEMMNNRYKGGVRYRDNPFTGILRCADCGQVLNLFDARRGMRENPLENFIYACNNYNAYGTAACTQHRIVAKDLHDLVLADLNQLARQSLQDPEFLRKLRELAGAKTAEQLAKARTDKRKHERRLAELDDLFSALYEDKALGRIPLANYEKLSERYLREQDEIQALLDSANAVIAEQADLQRQTDTFAKLLAKYDGIQELTRTAITELIDKILVHEKETDEDGNATQKIEICYKMIGSIEPMEYTVEAPVWVYPPRTCEACGKTFTPYGSRARFCKECSKKRQRYFSNESKKRIRARDKAAQRGDHRFNEKTCPICGKAFWPELSGRQTYCSDECKDVVYKARLKEIAERKRQQKQEQNGVA